MIRAEKKVVLAWTHAQALHFAKSMDWKRSEWEYLNPNDGDARAIRGRYGVVLYEVRAPRYKPDAVQASQMNGLISNHILPALNSERIIRRNIVNLP